MKTQYYIFLLSLFSGQNEEFKSWLREFQDRFKLSDQLTGRSANAYLENS